MGLHGLVIKAELYPSGPHITHFGWFETGLEVTAHAPNYPKPSAIHSFMVLLITNKTQVIDGLNVYSTL